jgi:hypothetical protein
VDYPAIWIDKVLRHQGLYKDFRLYVAAALNLQGNPKLLGICRSANDEDYVSWFNLFNDLKKKGLKLAPVTGTLDHQAIMGIKNAYKEFSPVRPPEASLRKVMEYIPPERKEYAVTLCESIMDTKYTPKIDEYVALFTKHFALTDPRVVLNLLNPDRYLVKFKDNDDLDTPGNPKKKK